MWGSPMLRKKRWGEHIDMVVSGVMHDLMRMRRCGVGGAASAMKIKG